MKRILSLFQVLLTTFIILSSPLLSVSAFAQSRPYAVMLSMDGFRWDYAAHAQTPTLDSLARVGVMVEQMQPSFPSKTFPNHYTLVTGLVPDHHGIVLNNFYDPSTERNYKYKDRAAITNSSFYSGDPIWCVAERNSLRAASYFWVGSEAEINNCKASYWKRYNNDFAYGRRIDSVIAWLSLPHPVRPHLVLWYFDEPDGVGHEFGPLSAECISKVEELDSLLSVFFTKARRLSQFDSINFIIVSDHGMGSISDQKVVYMNRYVKRSWVEQSQGGNPIYLLQASPGMLDTVYKGLLKVDHIQVWKSDEVPSHLNFGTNARALDLVVVADSGWSLAWGPGGSSYRGGNHGYDNTNTDMQAIFYAAGPAFKKGFSIPAIHNTDVYPLLCHLLQIPCPPCDGSFDRVRPLLIIDN